MSYWEIYDGCGSKKKTLLEAVMLGKPNNLYKSMLNVNLYCIGLFMEVYTNIIQIIVVHNFYFEILYFIEIPKIKKKIY